MAVTAGHEKSGFCANVDSESLLGSRETKRRGVGENEYRNYKKVCNKWRLTVTGGDEGLKKYIFKNVMCKFAAGVI